MNMRIRKLIPQNGIVAVSRRNFNRVKFGTHTIGEVLRNEHFTNDPMALPESAHGSIPMYRIKLIMREPV